MSNNFCHHDSRCTGVGTAALVKVRKSSTVGTKNSVSVMAIRSVAALISQEKPRRHATGIRPAIVLDRTSRSVGEADQYRDSAGPGNARRYNSFAPRPTARNSRLPRSRWYEPVVFLGRDPGNQKRWHLQVVLQSIARPYPLLDGWISVSSKYRCQQPSRPAGRRDYPEFQKCTYGRRPGQIEIRVVPRY